MNDLIDKRGPGRPPRTAADEAPSASPITETAEFKSAVQVAVDDAVAKILATIAPAKNEGGIDAAGLAMAIAKLTDQGSKKKYVSPEVLKQRSDAHALMEKLIIEAHEQKKSARYRVTGKTLLADQVIEPMWVDQHHVAQPTEIDWAFVPNGSMKPINETAKAIYQAWMDSVGNVAKALPDPVYGVTAKGLVVHGRAVANAAGPRGLPTEVAVPPSNEGLIVHHKGAPGRGVQKNVLGTIAEPAVVSGI